MHLPISDAVHNLLWKKSAVFSSCSSVHLHKYRIGRVKRKKFELHKTVDLRWRVFCLRNMDKRFHQTFTCVVAESTSCGKTEYVAKFIFQYMQIYIYFFLWFFCSFLYLFFIKLFVCVKQIDSAWTREWEWNNLELFAQ